MQTRIGKKSTHTGQATAHYLACMAGVSFLAAAILRRDATSGCKCPLQEAVGVNGGGQDSADLRKMVASCQRASNACVDAHAARDLHGLKKRNVEFLGRASAVRKEVRRVLGGG